MDLRKINAIVQPTFFHLPRIEELIDDIPAGHSFITIDLASSYLQFAVTDKTSQRLSFTSLHKKYRFTRLPFGLVSSGFIFAQEFCKIISPMLLQRKILNYLDNNLIVAQSDDEALETLKNLFQIFRKFNLKVNPEKLTILKRQVKFLGFQLSQDGLSPPQSKVEIIAKLSSPKSPTEVKSFIAMVSFFRDFIPQLSKTIEPLLELSRKDAKFLWGEEQEKAFNSVKNALINPPILRPNLRKQRKQRHSRSRDGRFKNCARRSPRLAEKRNFPPDRLCFKIDVTNTKKIFYI